ncbi:MAG: hypothetical protein IIV99_07240 [Oscillospiraceae bacterium]|nr:hypothetical protein [Oscillospiraceae bacterium]
MSQQQQPPRRLTRKELLKRNKRIQKKRQMRLTFIAVVVTAFLIYITGAFGASLAYLGDFVSSAMVYMQFGGGYPVQIENQTYLQSEKMGSSLCILDGDSLSFFSPTGDKVYEYHHSMQSPVINTSAKRVVIYNGNQTSLKVANAHNILFSQEMTNDIIHASLSDNNHLAVTTKSQSYNGEVKVFDSQMSEVFTWLNAKSFPIQSFLSPKAQILAASCLSAKDGSLVSDVYIIGTDDGSERFVVQNTEGAVLGMEFIREDILVIFYTDKAVTVDLATGQTTHSYSYEGRDLTAYTIRNSQILMALGDYDGLETTRLVLTDLSFGGAYTMETVRNITDVEIANQRICAFGDGAVEQYSLKGVFAGETQVKNNAKAIIDYQGCTVVSGDSIDRLEKASLKKKG